MSESEWTEFQFYEHQLTVIDTKANNIITVDSLVILISTLTSLLGIQVGTDVRIVATSATLGILVSVGLCVRTIWTMWASDLIATDHSNTIQQVKSLRNSKTLFLKYSLITLIISLGLYAAALVLANLHSTGI